jgi:MazG family protein
MDQFDSLLSVAEKLLGPNGCPWDRKQTFLSLQPYILEETHEVIEAVDGDDDRKMIEELGDLLFTIVFYGKLGEKSGRFSVDEIINTVKEKLIRRHPHVFGDVKVEDADDVLKNWEKIKALEKGEAQQESALDGIPPTIPLLLRAQKILKRIQRSGSTLLCKDVETATEEEIGEQLMDLILCAEASGVDAESALRRSLARLEKLFRASEKVEPS